MTIPFFGTIPLVYLKVKSMIKSMTLFLTNQNFSQLKAVGTNDKELKKLSDAICKIIEENMLVRSRFSELEKKFLDQHLYL